MVPHVPRRHEGGTLGAAYRFSSVLNHEVSLGYTVVGGPTHRPRPGHLHQRLPQRRGVEGLSTGSTSSTSRALYRNLQASQRTAMLRMWMAWHGGEPRTQPGKLISPHDPIGGLFTWTSDPAWQIEGAYTATGASCRGGALATGVHRRYLNPVANPARLVLPAHCNTAAKVAEFGVLGVKVNN